MAILSNGKFYGFLCSVKATGRKLSNGVKEYVEDFVSGFAGHGWKLWEYIKGKWKLEIDSLVVRETMVVFELLIQKIRAVKGALGITQACGRIKTATLDESGQNWLVTIEDEMSFVAHDFIRCQDWTNGTLKGYWVEISEIRKIDGVDTIVIPVSEFTGGIGYTDGMEAVDPALSGMTTPAVSDEIVYTKNGSTSSNEDRVKFRMLDPTTCWYSTAVIDGETSPSWSEPVIFPTDSKTEEQVYLLAKSKRNVIDLPTSNEYVNEYIGDAPEYSSSKFYSAGNIVKYNNVYKVAIQAHSGIAPTNEAYWEDVLWWVDNPRGASETYPYEYTCERTLQDGKWGEYKNYHLFGHYGKDGEPGADGKDANLLPWVEQWNNNKTLIDGEYIVSPKMFSGTKDSGGKLTGIALGRDCITVDGEKRTGIFALVGGNIVFKLDPISEEYEFQGSVVADSITMKDFAHLSQAIFKGDFMFSQQGIDADGNPTSNYQEFNQENPQGGNFKPNLAFNLKTGDQYSNGGHVYGFATNTPIQTNSTSLDPDKVAYSKVNILFSGTSSLRLPNDKKFDGVEFTIVSTASRSFDGSANIYREGGGDTNYSATGIHYKGVEIRTCYMRSEGSFIRLIAHWNGSKLKYYVVGHSDNFAMIEPVLNTQGISATLGIWFVDRVCTSSTSMRVYYNDINLFLFMLNVYSGKDAPNTGGLNFTSPSS